MYHLQTVLFPKSKFTIAQAIQWLKAHEMKYHKVDTGDHYLRFRQMEPPTGGRYRTKTLPNGVELVIHYKDF
jgi:hypothetical protein